MRDDPKATKDITGGSPTSAGAEAAKAGPMQPMASPSADAMLANVDKSRANHQQALKDAADPEDAKPSDAA